MDQDRPACLESLELIARHLVERGIDAFLKELGAWTGTQFKTQGVLLIGTEAAHGDELAQMREGLAGTAVVRTGD